MLRLFLCILLCLAFGSLQAQPTQDFEMEVLIPCHKVENQSYSGTCWSFATCSFFESELMRQNKPSVILSKMFVARKTYPLKVEKYLQTAGKTFFTAGGQPHDVLYTIRHFGIVPESIYNGKVFFQEHYHPPLDTLMWQATQNFIANGKKSLNEADKAFLEKVLDLFLGKVPEKFIYEGQTYTPQTFAQNYLKINPDDYVQVTSWLGEPFYQKIILPDKYNWMQEGYYNVPLQEFWELTQNAIRKGFGVVWNGDNVEPTFSAEQGLAFLPDTIKISPENRQRYIKNGSTQIEHVMHIVGIAKEKNEKNPPRTKRSKKITQIPTKTWFYIKNSWGEISKFHGFLYMSEDFFKMKTISIMLHKEALPTELRKKLKI